MASASISRGDEWIFGRIRSKRMLLPDKLRGVIDFSPSLGWHECTDRYHVSRMGNPELPSSHLLLFTLHGEGIGVLNDVKRPLLRGSVMIFPKDIPHAYYVPKGKKWEFYWIHLDGANCSSLLSHILREHGDCFEPIHFDGLTESVELLLDTDYRYYDYEFFAAQIISKMLFMLCDGPRSRSPEINRRKALVIRTIEYLEIHYSRPIRLEDIGESLHLSVEHIIRIFREETGMTPYQYLKQLRLRRACTLLTESDMSIGEIAAAVGYQSVSAFIAQFKSCYGITPRAYRNY